MENKINYSTYTRLSFAVYFVEIYELPLNLLAKKFIENLIESTGLKKTNFTEFCIFSKNKHFFLATATGNLNRDQIQNIFLQGDEFPDSRDDIFFEKTLLKNEIINKNIKNHEKFHRSVIHKQDLGFVGEMSSESMPGGINFDDIKII